MVNQWEHTPWMIGGVGRDVPHSSGIARLLSYAAFAGEEGIVGALDLEVTALATPGASVRVFPGACSIINRASGSNYEAYAARLPAQDTVAIAPTGGAGRTDLIVARVENPFISGEPYSVPSQASIDAGTAEFVRTVVISGVAAGIKSAREVAGGAYSAIALAKVTIPASTSIITQAMITDLRQMTNVRSDRGLYIRPPTGSDTLSSASFVGWPQATAVSVDIPDWANYAIVRGIIAGVAVPAGNFTGRMRAVIGADVAVTPEVILNSAVASGTDRLVYMGGGSMAIPASLRGTTQTIKMETKKDNGPSVTADVNTICSMEVEFSQTPQSNLS